MAEILLGRWGMAREKSDGFDAQNDGVRSQHAGVLHRGQCEVHGGPGAAMGDDKNGGSPVSVAILAHPVDADARIAQDGCDLGQRAGFVVQRHAQIVGGGQNGGRRLALGQGGGRLAKDRQAQAPRDIADVAHHGRGCGPLAGTGPAQHDLVHGAAFDGDHIGAALKLTQRGRVRHKARHHPLLQPASGLLGHAQELDLIAHISGMPDVFDADPLDPFQLDPVKIHLGAKGDGGQDGQFVRRIDAAHVKLRIGLQVAQTIRLGKDLGIGQARRFHARQDVIARPVHHTHDARDLVASEPLGQGLDHRDATGNSGLIAQGHLCGFCRLCQCLAVNGQHRLVGGNHMFARRNGRFGRVLGGTIGAAHQFDKNVHIGARGQSNGVVFPRVVGQGDAPILVAIAGADSGDLDRRPGARGQKCCVLAHDFDDACANGAQSCNAEAQGSVHVGFLIRTQLFAAM
mmetsp:Transcript_7558/g.12975  ORF Transcript_7558/g.12975 Transcript_7558/m.12975 type:complete len:458 (+) Transcript_7558:1374-2747(+)